MYQRTRLYAAWLVGLLVWVGIAGCGGAGSGDIVGTWELDRDASTAAAQRQVEASGSLMAGAMSAAMAEMIGAMDWTVTLDGAGNAALRFAEGGGEYETSGAWHLDGDALRLEYYDHRDRTVVLNGTFDGRTITMTSPDPGGPAMILRTSRRPALAIEPPPPVPPLGPLRAECPPTLTSSRRQGGPVDDIVQLRPGMPYEEVVAVLECRDDIRLIQTAPLFSIQDNFGIPTRQLVRGSDGVPCSAREARGDRCRTLGRFEPLRDASREYIVAFTGLPGEEIARAIWRRSVFDDQDSPGVSVLTQGLAEKYGPAQVQAVGSHSRINSMPPGATTLVWIYNRDGSAAPPPASEFSAAGLNWETCVNGPNPSFAARHGWNSGCELTIRAEIMPRADNAVLARELNMVVMNQRDFYHANQQFATALRLVGEERARQSRTPPEL